MIIKNNRIRYSITKVKYIDDDNKIQEKYCKTQHILPIESAGMILYNYELMKKSLEKKMFVDIIEKIIEYKIDSLHNEYIQLKNNETEISKYPYDHTLIINYIIKNKIIYPSFSLF
jgi:hypothetical protein